MALVLTLTLVLLVMVLPVLVLVVVVVVVVLDMVRGYGGGCVGRRFDQFVLLYLTSCRNSKPNLGHVVSDRLGKFLELEGVTRSEKASVGTGDDHPLFLGSATS